METLEKRRRPIHGRGGHETASPPASGDNADVLLEATLRRKNMMVERSTSGDIWDAIAYLTDPPATNDRKGALVEISAYAGNTSDRNWRRLMGDHQDRKELQRTIRRGILDERFAKLFCSKSPNVILLQILRPAEDSEGQRKKLKLSMESQPFVKATRHKMEIRLYNEGNLWFPIVERGKILRCGQDDMLPGVASSMQLTKKRLRPSAMQQIAEGGNLRRTSTDAPEAESTLEQSEGSAQIEAAATEVKTEAPQWPREPGDDLDTPFWALGCILPVVKATPGTKIYDPFYSTGKVTAG